MLTPPAGLKVFVATRPVDFRRGANTLATFAKEVLGQDPFSGVALVFRSKRADRVKILAWDDSGKAYHPSIYPDLPKLGELSQAGQAAAERSQALFEQ
jgi:transposase